MTSISNLIQNEEAVTLTKLTLSTVQERVQIITRCTGLAQWQIKVEPKDLKSDLFRIKTFRERHAAILYFDPERNYTTEDFNLGLCHEIAHLMVDNMREEHDIQRSFYMSSDKKQEAEMRFTRRLEQSVETIAKALYTAIYKPM